MEDQEMEGFALEPSKPTIRMRAVWFFRDLKYRARQSVICFALWLIKVSTERSNLVSHADYELRKAGLFDTDSDYDGMLGTAIMDLVRLFACQDHSGFSAALTMRCFGVVADYKTLTPLSSDPDEWNEVTSGEWQNRRDGRCFSKDGGKTWYNYEDCRYVCRSASGATFTTGSLDGLEPGETVVKEKQCFQCMLKDNCPKQKGEQKQ